MAFEEARSSARGLVRASGLILVLAQLLGISVVLPALWLPCFLLFSKGKVEGAFLPAGKALPIRAGNVFNSLFTVLLTYASRLPPEAQLKAIVAFNLGIPCVALLWTFCPGGRKQGNAAAAATFRSVAVVAFALHVLSLVDILYSHGGSPAAALQSLVAVARNESATVMPANFMYFDFLGVLGASLLFAVADSGLSGATAVAGVALAVGPGAALAMALAHREERLAEAAAPAPGVQAAGAKCD